MLVDLGRETRAHRHPTGSEACGLGRETRAHRHFTGSGAFVAFGEQRRMHICISGGVGWGARGFWRLVLI